MKPYNPDAYFLSEEERRDYQNLLINILPFFKDVIINLDDIELMDLNESDDKKNWLQDYVE